jgi:hypothetical protein
MPAPSAQPFAGRDGFRANQYRDGFRNDVSRDGFRNDSINGAPDSNTVNRIAPRTAAPKYRAAPPVQSMPRPNRIPATRIPAR